MKIVILLAEKTASYGGGVRPFINWVKGLSRRHEIYFVLYKCDKELIDAVKSINDVQAKSLSSLSRLKKYLNKIRSEIILTEDYLPMLRLLSDIKSEIKSKTVVYVQNLFGIHSITSLSNSFSPLRKRLLYKLIKLVPFNLLIMQYKKFLKMQDIIVANSKITATLLHVLYGVEPNEVIYPPLDTRIFKFQSIKKRKQVLLYLGSIYDDSNEDLILNILEILKEKNFKLLAMGNEILKKRLQKRFRIYSISEVSDEELAKIYSQSKLTICPQKLETFGYIPIESVACGTPVIAFDCMGFSETILNEKIGWLAKNKQEFLNTLVFVLKKKIQVNQNFVNEYIKRNFSIEASVKKLEEVVKRITK
jgi:glycosyltransferase involved in cell wall biosynthesis